MALQACRTGCCLVVGTGDGVVVRLDDAMKAIAERNDLNTADVDDVIWGTSSQRGPVGTPAPHARCGSDGIGHA